MKLHITLLTLMIGGLLGFLGSTLMRAPSEVDQATFQGLLEFEGSVMPGSERSGGEGSGGGYWEKNSTLKGRIPAGDRSDPRLSLIEMFGKLSEIANRDGFNVDRNGVQVCQLVPAAESGLESVGLKVAIDWPRGGAAEGHQLLGTYRRLFLGVNFVHRDNPSACARWSALLDTRTGECHLLTNYSFGDRNVDTILTLTNADQFSGLERK